MRRLIALLGVVAALAAGGVSAVEASGGKRVPRTIIAFYDGGAYEDIRYTSIHRVIEMPFNHLGLILEYRDLNQPLPRDDELADVRGALLWSSGDTMPAALPFIEWAHRFMDGGRQLMIIGALGFAKDAGGKPTPLETINGLLARIGLRFEGQRVELTHDVRVVRKDRGLLDFEAALPRQIPAYDRIAGIDARTSAYLVVREGNNTATDTTLISSHPNGGYIALDLIHRGDNLRTTRQLYLDLFEYLRRVFGTDDLPKPDTTTLVGRRIYYSHIDGDGWRNLSQVKAYAQRRSMSAEVILREVIEAYPDLPVTVAPIVADLDPSWFGSEQAQALARDIFALPQVEMASHTLSHPFDWGFFADGDAAKEVGLLKRYPRRPGGNDDEAWRPLLRAAARRSVAETADYSARFLGVFGTYSVPRAYAVRPFDLQSEIDGAIGFLNRLAPDGKRVMLLQWSGNCLPWDEAIVASYAAGVYNINGGDTRFDREQPSYTSVAPIGRKLARGVQIYSSNANENVYTDLWTSRFFGFTFLSQTWRNTEQPVRVKPKNLYYHMYSGEKTASLRALLNNLKEVESEPIAPIAASEYAALALGFFSAEIEGLGDARWRIGNRGRLATIRFDRSIDRRVDFARSSGVIGQMHLQGSLYVALDPDVIEPIVALTDSDPNDGTPAAPQPYLVESRWPVRKLAMVDSTFSFQAQGFGVGSMTWRVEAGRRYRIVASDDERSVESFADTGDDGLLAFTVRTRRYAPATVSVSRISGG
jgi:hypothetical protein